MQLETPRLILRDFRPDDWRRIAAYAEDPRFLRYYDPVRMEPVQVQERVERFIAWQHDQPRLNFQLAITLRDSVDLIGSCGIRQRRLVNHGDFSALYEADLGYELHPKYWGHGYATEAARTLVRFGFEQLALHRVWAYCIVDNDASWRLMERLGMKREGLLRENHWMQGRWWDTLIYGVLAEEWRVLDHPRGGLKSTL